MADSSPVDSVPDWACGPRTTGARHLPEGFCMSRPRRSVRQPPAEDALITLKKMSTLSVATALLLLTAGCSAATRAETGAAARPHRPAASGVLVVAAGDIACAPGKAVTATSCQQAATARLAASFHPRYVLPLGDEQYDDGALTDFESSYARTWGQFNTISRPVPGNHDYHQSGAAGYFTYFQPETTPPGYYAVNIGRWRVYALNSNCSDIDCGAEATWLNQDMTAHPRDCTAITMHHPRYSSGAQHGDSPDVAPLWQVAVDHHADLALAGHDHEYERFRSMDANGHITRNGLVSFVVGTGGKDLYAKGATHAGSVLFDNHHFGVLALRLGQRGYAWRFKTIDGSTVDAGARRCH